MLLRTLGGLHAPAAAEWRLDLSRLTFAVAVSGLNNYYLFAGHVGEAVRIGHWVHERFFIGQSPRFFWPADRAWCVATTLDSTIIGGSHELVDELCASDLTSGDDEHTSSRIYGLTCVDAADSG